MSKLREKFYDAIRDEVYANESGYVDGIQYADEQCEQIADDFAVSFAEWIDETIINNSQLYYYSTTTELLQIFKSKYYE